MSENDTPAADERGPWWFVWILATSLLPGLMFGLLATMPGGSEELWSAVGLVVLILHLVSSVKLAREKSGWLMVGLIFGGWGLMLVSLFVGCLVVVSRG